MADVQPVQVFTKFPKLPLEIRRMIWKAALPGPRVVTIRHAPLKITVGEWNEMTEAERVAVSGRPADTESLYTRMRNGVGPEKLWKLPESVGARIMREVPSLSMSQESDFAGIYWTMEDIFREDLHTNYSLCDTIYYHLAQGVTIDAIHSFLGLPNEKDVHILMDVGRASRNPYFRSYGEALDYLDPVLIRPLTGIRSNRLPIQTQYACHESHQVSSSSYSKIFSTKISVPETYFDFKRDTLFLQGSKFIPQIGIHYMATWLPMGISHITDTENLERVRNIAILLDHFETAKEHASRMCYWLASLFCYFVDIKRVALVFGCLEQDAVSGGFRNYTPGKQDNPCFFIDPEVVEAACEENELFNDKDTEDVERLMREFRQTEKQFIDCNRLEMDKLESLRLASSEEGKPRWSMPIIEHKVAISPTHYECEDDLAAIEYFWERVKIAVFDDSQGHTANSLPRSRLPEQPI